MKFSHLVANLFTLHVFMVDIAAGIRCIQCSEHGDDEGMTKRCLDGHVSPRSCKDGHTHCLTFVEIDTEGHLQVNWRSCGTRAISELGDKLSCSRYKFPAKGSRLDKSVYTVDGRMLREEHLHVCTAACNIDGCVMYRASIANSSPAFQTSAISHFTFVLIAMFTLPQLLL